VTPAGSPTVTLTCRITWPALSCTDPRSFAVLQGDCLEARVVAQNDQDVGYRASIASEYGTQAFPSANTPPASRNARSND
jgi:hypothetical protein